MIRSTAIFMFVAMTAGAALGGDITGPDNVQAGQFASFTSELEGDWALFPDMPGCHAKDSSGKIFYLAIPDNGVYSVAHFALSEGKPVIETKTLTVGGRDTKPDKQDAELTEDEKAALFYAASEVLKRVNEGTVKTPQAARATFRLALTTKLAGDVSDAMDAKLKALTSKGVGTMEEIKKVMTDITGCASGTCPYKR